MINELLEGNFKFVIEELQLYCNHHEIEVEGVKSKYVKAVWEFIEDNYDWETDSDLSNGSDDDSDDE